MHYLSLHLLLDMQMRYQLLDLFKVIYQQAIMVQFIGVANHQSVQHEQFLIQVLVDYLQYMNQIKV